MRTPRKIVVGMTSGTMTRRAICPSLAPSIRAASISERSIFVMAEANSSVENPTSFQPVMKMMVQIAVSASATTTGAIIIGTKISAR